MAYFKGMGTVWYTLDDGTTVQMNDITAFATISDTWKKDARVQIAYSVRDGELPHMISYRLYGTVDYWWTILLANEIYDFDSQWPRNSTQLNDYIALKYPGSNLDDVHHYIDSNGLIADLLACRIGMGLASTTPDADVINLANLDPISIQDFEVALNEAKRNIFLIDPDYIGSIQTEYDTAMEGTA